MNDQGPRRVGWVVVALGAVALGVLAVYLVSDGLGIGPIDEAWVYVAWFMSPLLAAGASVAIGVLLMVVAAFKLVDIAFSRAAKATAVGCLLAPVLFVLSMFSLVALLDSLDAQLSWPIPWLLFALPIAIGVATVIVYVVPTNTLPAKDQQMPAVVDNPEKVLEKTIHERLDYRDEFGLSARVVLELPNDAYEVILEIALGVPRAFELLSAVIGRLGRVIAEDRGDNGASLQAVVGAGFLNKVPAVVTVRITEVNPSRSKVIIAGLSKESSIKQRAAEGAVRQILKAANLPAPAGGLPTSPPQAPDS